MLSVRTRYPALITDASRLFSGSSHFGSRAQKSIRRTRLAIEDVAARGVAHGGLVPSPDTGRADRRPLFLIRPARPFARRAEEARSRTDVSPAFTSALRLKKSAALLSKLTKLCQVEQVLCSACGTFRTFESVERHDEDATPE